MVRQRGYRIVPALLLSLIAGCGMYGGGSGGARDGGNTGGTVTIRYTVTRIPGNSSNQWAIWIEDTGGAYVKTLFVNDYTARGQGWRARPQMLLNWRRAADLEHMSREDIDAISQATPRVGVHSVVWDITDMAGNAVPPGAYTYHIEGSLPWDNSMIWTGAIAVGDSAAVSQATVSYRYVPEGTANSGRMLISDVTAEFVPGE